METKECRDCGRETPLADFPPDDRNDDGRGGSCHECVSLRTRLWRERSKANRAKQREWNRLYMARKRAERAADSA